MSCLDHLSTHACVDSEVEHSRFWKKRTGVSIALQAFPNKYMEKVDYDLGTRSERSQPKLGAKELQKKNRIRLQDRKRQISVVVARMC
jgi:hypothetical protein